MKQILLIITIILSFNSHANLDANNNIIQSSIILASDINTKLTDLEGAISLNIDIPNINFPKVTSGDTVDKNLLLSKFYTQLPLLYPVGNELDNLLG